MSLRRVIVLTTVLWLLVATNPDASSFNDYLSEHASNSRRVHRTERCTVHDGTSVCVRHRRAFSPLNAFLKSLFAAHGVLKTESFSTYPSARSGTTPVLRLELVDCAIFSVARTPATNIHNAPHLFFGAFGRWIPAPSLRAFLSDASLRSLLRAVQRSDARRFYERMRGSSRLQEGALPGRPWEWLLALFAMVGVGWLLFPDRAAAHLTLTWENVRHSGNWWCMVFFHLSHGGSLLRLGRTVVLVAYLPPVLIRKRILTLSDLYGVVLTGSALSTALGMLVLARRYVYGARASTPRTALEINGGGGCVYALLVAACLSPRGYKQLAGGLMPFQILMFNIAFDAVFLAGQKCIADYTAHTGAALGAWLFCFISALR